MTTPTPCLGRHALYDTVLDRNTPVEERHQAQTIAAALCVRCPVAPMCPDRITRPLTPPRVRKDHAMPTTIPDITPPAAPQLDPADITPDTPQALIDWGKRHHSSRIQILAGKAHAALTDLRQAAERESAVAAAEARIKRLKAQLANAEKDLRAAKTTATPTAKHGASTARPDREELATIRAWAAENGHKVAPAGVIARPIVDAYRAAQKRAEKSTRLAEAS